MATKIRFNFRLSPIEITQQREERDLALRQVLKPILWSLQEGCCPHCMNPLEPLYVWEGKTSRVPKRHPTLEHVIPRSQGGKTMANNLLLAHRTCNGRKGNTDPSERELEMLARVTAYLRDRPALWTSLPYLIPASWFRTTQPAHAD